MKNLWKIFAVTLFLLTVFSIKEISATSYTAGVKVGDWAKYQYPLISWNSTDPNATEPREVTDAKSVEWIKVTVEQVSGTFVAVSETTYFKNKTETTISYSGDIATGNGNLKNRIIAKNLNAGEKIFGTALADSLNQTLLMKYANATRQVNYLGLSDIKGELIIDQIAMEIHWDRSTGILCGTAVTHIVQAGNQSTLSSLFYKITETNLWQPEETTGSIDWLPLLAVFAIALFMFLGIIWLLWKRRKRRRKPRVLRKRLTSRERSEKKQRATAYYFLTFL